MGFRIIAGKDEQLIFADLCRSPSFQSSDIGVSKLANPQIQLHTVPRRSPAFTFMENTHLQTMPWQSQQTVRLSQNTSHILPC